MPVYNVAATVVSLIEATDEGRAEKILAERLDQAGFEVYDGDSDIPTFESEDGVEPEVWPPQH